MSDHTPLPPGWLRDVIEESRLRVRAMDLADRIETEAELEAAERAIGKEDQSDV